MKSKTVDGGYNEMFFSVVARGEVTRVKYLLETEKIDINAVNEFKSTALYNACLLENWEVAKLLFQYGAMNVGKVTLLEFAVKAGQTDIVQLILENDVDNINFQNHDGVTVLELACMYKQWEVAKLLIEYGASNVGHALMLAIDQGQIDIVQSMLENGIDNINFQSVNGRTALDMASENEAMTALLIKYGAKFAKQDATDESKEEKDITKLMGKLEIDAKKTKPTTVNSGAARDDISEALKMEVDELVKSGIDNQDQDGQTALYKACRQDKWDLVKLLVQHEAKNIPSNISRNTPIMLATKAGKVDIVRSMLENGVDNINAQSGIGKTALDMASGNEAMTALLIKYGAKSAKQNVTDESNEEKDITKLMGTLEIDASKTTPANNTEELYDKIGLDGILGTGLYHSLEAFGADEKKITLHQACYSEEWDLAKHLIETGEKNVAGKNGVTPLMIAVTRGQVGIVQLMLGVGVDNIDAKDLYGNTALCYACECYTTERNMARRNRGDDNYNPYDNNIVRFGDGSCSMVGSEYGFIMYCLIRFGANIDDVKLDPYPEIFTIRNYQNRVLAAEHHNYDHILAVINKFMQNGEIRHDWIKCKEYADAIAYVKIQKIFKNDSKESPQIYGVSQDEAVGYIKSGFIVPYIKNKLLLNAFHWYKKDLNGDYKLDVETYNKVTCWMGMENMKYSKLIKMDDITGVDFSKIPGSEYSNHVYNMIMHHIEKDYANGIKLFNKYYTRNGTKDDTSMVHFLEYVKNFTSAHAPEDSDKIQALKNLGLFFVLNNILPGDAALQGYVEKHYHQMQKKEEDFNATKEFLQFLTLNLDEDVFLDIAKDEVLLQPDLLDDASVNNIIGQLHNLCMCNDSLYQV